MEQKLRRFFSSITFRLTLWYSFVIIIIAAVFVIIINVLITDYYRQGPMSEFYGFRRGMLEPPVGVLRMEEAEEYMRTSQMEDLETIRRISALSFVPLTFLSFAGGYFISSRMLHPLKKLNLRMSTTTTSDLTRTLDFEDTGDEMSDLMKNFNAMILRLDKTFDAQRQFTENASHELKTPLAVVQTNLAAVLDQQKISQEELKVLLSTAMKSAEFMDNLIEDLLLLSLLDQDISKEQVSVNSIVRHGIEQAEVLAGKRGITIHTSPAPKEVYVLANPVLLQRAIMNIIENAVQYSPEESTVNVAIATDGPEIRISISDSGTGIPKSEQAKIFDRFYRVDKSRSRKTGGVGLGLAIVKQIVELHQGTITVKSGRKGSTFTITLPAVPSDTSTTHRKIR